MGSSLLSLELLPTGTVGQRQATPTIFIEELNCHNKFVAILVCCRLLHVGFEKHNLRPSKSKKKIDPQNPNFCKIFR
jgi:hypothetical protein